MRGPGDGFRRDVHVVPDAVHHARAELEKEEDRTGTDRHYA